MKKLKFHAHLIVCGFVWHWLIVFQLIAYAGVSIGETIDCTDVSVDYRDDLTLTHEERLRLMDEAFVQSLNRFELCQSAKKMAASSGKGANDGNGTEGGAGGLTGNSGGTSPNGTSPAGTSPDGKSQEVKSIGESVAGSTMSGTDTPKNIPPGGETEVSGDLKSPQDKKDQKDQKDQKESGANTYGKKQLSNGKLPEDIPPAQNDDALAAQIRYAAENETDPAKANQLWNEYRKYKGLPTK